MTKHKINSHKQYFEEFLHGKNFDVRYNDRGYQVEDIVLIQEIIPAPTGKPPYVHTGRLIWARVVCVSSFQQAPGFVVLGLKEMELINGEA
jgi:hypothetical protein